MLITTDLVAVIVIMLAAIRGLGVVKVLDICSVASLPSRAWAIQIVGVMH